MLHRGIFLRRYKRFFAEISSDSGEILTLHCPNTGSLKNCLIGEENSRLDFRLQSSKNLLPDCFLEVKSATYDIGNGIILFPDSVTSRGAKHLRELTSAVEKGYRAVLFFCVQVSNSKMLKIADNIDPYYADTLAKAVTAGVEVKTWNTRLSGDEVTLKDQIEFSY